jgi:hypothetical protein
MECLGRASRKLLHRISVWSEWLTMLAVLNLGCCRLAALAEPETEAPRWPERGPRA